MEKFFKTTLMVIILTFIGIIGIKYFFIYFSPFIIAAVLASLINPLVMKMIDLLPISRGVAVFIVLVILIAVFVVLIIFGASQVYLELNRLLSNLPDYNTLGSQMQWIINQNNKLQELINDLNLSSAISDALNDNLQLLYNALKRELVSIINSLLNLIGKLPLILTILFLSFIATFFICKDRDEINEFIMGLFPSKWRSKLFQLEKELVTSSIGFIKAELILISITGVISGVGLTLIGNQYALIIGITSALLDLIPIIGPALIFIPWIIYNVFLGNISFGFKLLVVYTLMAAFRSGAEGKVMGSNLGMHPLTTMIALYVGYRVMGAIGFIVGPAVLVVCKSLINADIIPYFRNIKE